MSALFAFFAVYAAASIVCGIVRKLPKSSHKAAKTTRTKTAPQATQMPQSAPKPEPKPTPTRAPAAPCAAILDALNAQRDELHQQLDIISGALDNAPPERERMKWLKERTRVYGQLASVEAKIQKLRG